MTRMQNISFPGVGGDLLAGRLELPAGKPRAYAVFAHCFTCGKDMLAAKRIADGLTGQGFAVLRFDFTGLGASDGEFANTNFSSNVGDLLQAVEHLRAEHEAPALLVGHSLGGAAVLAAAGRIPEVRAVATIGAPSDPGHVARLIAGARPEIKASGEAEVTIAGRRFRIKKQFLQDIESQTLTEAIRTMRKPLMIFHSPIDDTVSIDSAAEIFMAAKHPKSFVSLDTANHLLSRREDASYVASVLAAWAERYLPPREEAAATDDGLVLVRETGHGKFQNEVVSGPHRMFADEPASVGGDATGPTPYGFLLAGLGACTSMTIRMYAEHKKWPLANVSVTLQHDKIHADDCAECETREGKIDLISRVIGIEGDLDAEQRARLLEIADKCPVHRTLHSEIKIVTTLGD